MNIQDKAKYPEIADIIRNRIKRGVYKDILPGAGVFAREFAVTPMTANRALNKLQDENYVRRESYKGTFVNTKREKPKLILYHEVFPVDSNKFFDALDMDIQVFNAASWRSMDYVEYIEKTPDADIISVDEGSISAMAERGMLKPLDDVWSYFKNIKENDFHCKVLDAFRYKGRLYGLPVACTPVVIFYNKGIFDACNIPYPDSDWKWHDLIKYCTEFKNNNYGPQYSLSGILTGINKFTPFIYQNNGQLFDAEGIPSLGGTAIEALKFLRDLITAEHMPLYMNASNSLHKLFIANQLAMYIGDYSDYSIFLKNNLDGIGIAQLPANECKSTSISVQGWGISSKSDIDLSHMEHLYQKDNLNLLFKDYHRICAFRTDRLDVPHEFIESLEFSHRSWDSPRLEMLNNFLERLDLFWLGLDWKNTDIRMNV